MSFSEELAEIEGQELRTILERVLQEYINDPTSVPDVPGSDYPALTAIASFAFQRAGHAQDMLEGEIEGIPPADLTGESAADLAHWIKGLAIGVWATAAALKEYADLEKLRDEGFDLD